MTRTVDIAFGDGGTASFNDIPDNVTPDAFYAKVKTKFPDREVKEITRHPVVGADAPKHEGMEHKSASGQGQANPEASDLGHISQEGYAGLASLPVDIVAGENALQNSALQSLTPSTHHGANLFSAASKAIREGTSYYVNKAFPELKHNIESFPVQSTKDEEEFLRIKHDIPARSEMGKLFGDIANQLGSNVIFALAPEAGAVKKAYQGTKAAEAVAASAKTVKTKFGSEVVRTAAKPAVEAVAGGVKPAAKELTRAAIQTGLTSGGGGLGQYEAELYSDSPYAPFIGSIIGGTWGFGLLPFIVKGLGNAIMSGHPIEYAKQAYGNAKEWTGSTVQPWIDKKVKGKIAEAVTKFENENGVGNLKEAMDLQKKIRGINFTAAQSTGVQQLKATEQSVNKSSINAYTASLLQEKKNAIAAIEHIQSPGSDTSKAMQSHIDTLAKQREMQGFELQKKSDELANKMLGLKEKVTVNMTPEQRGQSLQKQRAIEQSKEDAIKNAKYNAAKIEAKKLDAKFDTSVISLEAQHALDNPLNAYDPSNTPSIIRMIKEKHTPKQPEGTVEPIYDPYGQKSGEKNIPAEPVVGTTGYDDLLAMRSAVNADLRQELSSYSENQRSRVRSLVGIKRKIDSAITTSPYDTVKALDISANNHFKSVYAPKFSKGLNYKSTHTTNAGDQLILDEKLLGQYSSNVNNTRRFITLFGKNPEAVAAMQDHFMEQYEKQGMKNGEIDVAKHDTFMQKNKHVLDVLKENGVDVKDQFIDIRKTAENIQKKQSYVTLNQQQHAKDSLKDILGTGDVVAVVNKAMESPRTMQTFVSKLDADGRKSLMDYVIRDVSKTFAHDDQIGLDTKAVSSYLEKNKRQLDVLFKSALGDKEGAAHMKRLEESYRVAQIMNRASLRGTPPDQIGSDPFQNAMGFSFRTFFNLARAQMAGRTSLADVSVALGGQAATHHYIKAFNEIQQKILTDPEASKSLEQMIKEAGKLKPDMEVMHGLYDKMMKGSGAAKNNAGKFVHHSISHYAGNAKRALPGAISASLKSDQQGVVQDSDKIDLPEDWNK